VAFLGCKVAQIKIPDWFWLLPVAAVFIGGFLGGTVVWIVGENKVKKEET
jgi:hypothetical protein